MLHELGHGVLNLKHNSINTDIMYKSSVIYDLDEFRESYFFFPVILSYIIQTNGTEVNTKANISTVNQGIPVNTSTSSIKKYNTKPIIVKRRGVLFNSLNETYLFICHVLKVIKNPDQKQLHQ